MKNILIIVVIIIIIGAIGFGMTRNNENEEVGTNDYNNQPEVAQEDNEVVEEDSIEGDSIMDEIDTSTSSGEYIDYQESLLARADQGDVVLFFHASWCPTCKALDSSLGKDAKQIPGDLTILKIDYDSAKELKKKYGIVIQHTLVQVDSDGNEIAKWTGGNNLESITKRLK